MSITVTGEKETIKKLWIYNDAFIKNAKRITRKASKNVEDDYKTRVPVGKTGNLRKSVKAKNIYNRGGGPAATVMPRATKAGRGYHRHMVAYGTKPRSQRRGKSTGIMPRNDFTHGVGAAADAQFNADMQAEVSKHVVI